MGANTRASEQGVGFGVISSNALVLVALQIDRRLQSEAADQSPNLHSPNTFVF